MLLPEDPISLFYYEISTYSSGEDRGVICTSKHYKKKTVLVDASTATKKAGNFVWTGSVSQPSTSMGDDKRGGSKKSTDPKCF